MDYWKVESSVATRFGFLCRECHKSIEKGEEIIKRDGRKIRLIYHKKCFVGYGDPRSQPGSSFNQNKFAQSCFQSYAPKS